FHKSMGKLGDFDYDLHKLLDSPEAKSVMAEAQVCDRCWNNCVGLPSLALSPVRALRLLTEGFWPNATRSVTRAPQQPASRGTSTELPVLPNHGPHRRIDGRRP